MWRRLAIALFCAAVGFGFNSNPAGSGGAVAGGNCTGGQFMSGITTAGVPVCSTPSGGAPFPPGNLPQIGGYSALNTGEAETVVGDFTFARSGANQYTATVTKLGGITPGGTCTGSQFVNVISASGVPTCAALPAPAAGSITDAMLTGAYSGVGACSAGSVTTTLNRNAAPICTAIGTVGSGVFAPIPNPAGGASNYASAANPTFTGTVTMPAGSITDAMHASAYSGVGACTGGQFVSTLNRNAAPTCTAPPTGFTAGGDLTGTATSQTVIGIRSTSVPALASGYLHYSGTAFVWDTPGGGFTAGGDLSGTATSQTVIGIRSTSVPVLAAGYLQYTGSAFAWTTPAAGAPATNPAGGANNYAAIASPTLTGTVTAPILNLTGTAPALTFGGVAMGGSCGTNSYVSSISNAGVPTCGVNLASLYAPLTNPSLGQNNYAPLSNPTFSGVMTFPDGSTYSTAGHNNMVALGVGTAAGTGGNLVTAQNNGNNFSGYYAGNNNTSGTSAAAGIFLQTTASPNKYGVMQLSGPNGSAVGDGIADQLQISTTGSNGMALVANTSNVNIYANSSNPYIFSNTGLYLAHLQLQGVSNASSCSTQSNSFALGVGASRGLISVGSYGAPAGGILHVVANFSGSVTASTYLVSFMGSGGGGGIVAATTNYAGGAATFTITDVQNSPSNGYDQIFMNNTSGTAFAQAYYSFLQVGGTPVTCY